MNYEQENAHIFLYKLTHEFHKIQNEVYRHLRVQLSMPNFAIIKSKSFYGRYTHERREIAFSQNLLVNFEWDAVIYVLRHEVAHMIVREIWGDLTARSHGESFKKACNILNIEAHCCSTPHYLNAFKGVDNESPVVDRIRKLMAKGQCSSASESEAEAFMQKARQLMNVHNLSHSEITGTQRVFVKRPVGGRHRRYATWLSVIGKLLQDNYNVNYIHTSAYDFKNNDRCDFLEIFGEVHNVDIAEYIGHVLIRQGESLYERYKKDPNRNKNYGRLSKNAFMEGLIAGYKSTLLKEKQNDEPLTEDQHAIILANDKMLNEKFRQAYPNLRIVKSTRSVGNGYSAGMSAGKGISVNTPVGGSGNKVLRLT